ncbi:hypothetical protein GCM10007415_10660 [Parapedobacter pyrenivorans]|uniref:Uncharacterized protein n=1 Tax=Parapedobacter pyrenivorans TaxID=1305674 RepID=A0A917HIL5_9SPHI|nr:hypothetical protein GCM10007415_10660 [Parapedobacter pyrenivorans]
MYNSTFKTITLIVSDSIEKLISHSFTYEYYLLRAIQYLMQDSYEIRSNPHKHIDIRTSDSDYIRELELLIELKRQKTVTIKR